MQSSEQSVNSLEGVQDAEDNALSGMDSLAELLAAGEPGNETTETPGGDPAESGGSKEKTKPTKFNDLAGALDVDLDTLYKLNVSIDGHEEPVTVEMLKDSYKQRRDFELERIEFDETISSQQAELLRAKTELNEILQSLPKNAVRPEVLAKIRARHDQTMKAERARTLDAIKSWSDPDKRTADLAAMSEHLSQYGFSVDYLAQIQDHRMFPYIRDNMLREKRVREALAKVKAGKPKPSATPKPQQKAPKKGATTASVKRKSYPDKLAAVFSTVD